MDYVKPCPFCGGEAEVVQEIDSYEYNYVCFCINCSARIGSYISKQTVKDAWNKREKE